MTASLDLFTSFMGRSLARILSADSQEPALEVIAHTFPSAEANTGSSPAFVWSLADAVSPAYAAALRFAPPDHQTIEADVAAFAAMVGELARDRPAVFVASLVDRRHARGYGMLDLAPGTGLSYRLMEMNLQLAKALAAFPNVFLLNAELWLRMTGPLACQPKQWFVAKIPFHQSVFQAAASDVKAGLRALRGSRRKIIITDLDDTLWGGILGEVGWRDLRLGGHDHVGEMHRELQDVLKAWSRYGVQLAVVSKNDEADALAAFENHPDMLLRTTDLAGWRINWNNKADNIRSLLDELRLGLDSAVFLDDNPVERHLVRQCLPQVFVPELPEDRTLWPGVVAGLNVFDQPSVSREDRARTAMYVAERTRAASRGEGASVEDWVASLGIVVSPARLGGADLARAVQLLNKTNQMNLSTRRLTAEELMAWLQGPRRHLWTYRVADRFGDSGLTGIASLDLGDGHARLIDFVMSCRVIGRRIEDAILAHVIAQSQALGAAGFQAVLHPTERNTVCTEFFRRKSGLTEEEGNRFVWPMAETYPHPASVTLLPLPA